MKRVEVIMYALVDDDGIHCHPKCELRSFYGNGYHWEHYCSVFDLDLDYDGKCDKWIRCTNCIVNENAQKDMVCDAHIEKSATQATLPVSGATQAEVDNETAH